MNFINESQLGKVLNIASKCPNLKYLIVMNWKEKINEKTIENMFTYSKDLTLLSLFDIMEDKLVDIVPMKPNDVQTRFFLINFFTFVNVKFEISF